MCSMVNSNTDTYRILVDCHSKSAQQEVVISWSHNLLKPFVHKIRYKWLINGSFGVISGMVAVCLGFCSPFYFKVTSNH